MRAGSVLCTTDDDISYRYLEDDIAGSGDASNRSRFFNYAASRDLMTMTNALRYKSGAGATKTAQRDS